jgi:hypothetical protein
MKYIQYLDLPSVPKHLIKSVDEIVALPQKLMTEVPNEYQNVFNTRYVEPELDEWLKSIFDFPMFAQYQLIYNGIPVHKDKSNRLVAYNYLLATGGENVITTILSDDNKLLQFEKLQLHRWHRIETGYFHGVHGISDGSIRCSISITPITDRE